MKNWTALHEALVHIDSHLLNTALVRTEDYGQV